MREVRLHLDSRNRITLSKLLPDLEVSSVKAYWKGNKIILEPMIEIPANEAWLYHDPESLQSVKTGLSQPGIHDLGSFAEHANDDV